MKSGTVSNLVIVSDGNKKHPMDVHVVVKVKSENGFTIVYFYNHRILSLQIEFKELQELLLPHGFIRINKYCLVNPYYVESITPGKIALAQLSDGTEEQVSRDSRKILSTYLLETVYS